MITLCWGHDVAVFTKSFWVCFVAESASKWGVNHARKVKSICLSNFSQSSYKHNSTFSTIKHEMPFYTPFEKRKCFLIPNATLFISTWPNRLIWILYYLERKKKRFRTFKYSCSRLVDNLARPFIISPLRMYNS